MNTISLQNVLEGASIRRDDLSGVIDNLRRAEAHFLAAMRSHEERRNSHFEEAEKIRQGLSHETVA